MVHWNNYGNLKFYQIIDINDNVQKYPLYSVFYTINVEFLDIIIDTDYLIEFQVHVVM